MKYYVRSNQFKVLLAGEHLTSHREAAKEAFLQYYNDDCQVSTLVIVSERGFEYNRHEVQEDQVFSTCTILKEAGFLFEDEQDEC